MKQNSFTANDIERYHRGEMPAAEMHNLEKAALDDPMLADALEGYSFTQTASADLASLQQKLETRIYKHERKNVFSIGPGWMKIAALFILFAGGGWLVFQMFSNNNKKTELATTPPSLPQKAPDLVTNSKVSPDSGTVYSDAPLTTQATEKNASSIKGQRSNNTNLVVVNTPDASKYQIPPSTFSSALADSVKDKELYAYLEVMTWDPLESTCRHASLSIL